MASKKEDLSWKQHFPTYHFKERDVALEEYKFATKTLEADERVFLNAANLTVIVGAALGSLALGSLEKLTSAFSPVVPEPIVLVFVLTLSIGFALLSLRYFADRQKAVVFAARKVIVLRRMLGMSYGSLQLVLPNWRIEGADEPFAVRLFPGWHTYVAYPCYAIAGIASAVVFFVLAALVKALQSDVANFSLEPVSLVVAVAAISFVALCLSYRRALVDTHENVFLLVVQRLSKTLGLGLVGNIENTVYRATLGVHELHRLGIDTAAAKKALIQIEDKEFYSHIGISVRGIARMTMSIFGYGRRAGGSTITQQLARTLFIQDLSKIVRRKFIEILLALWANKIFSKERQLDMYLASVRFEANVFGIAAALKHFFGRVHGGVSPPEAFFLIERVSNVRSRLLVSKINQTLRGAVNSGWLTSIQAQEVVELYKDAITSGKVFDPDGDVSRLGNY